MLIRNFSEKEIEKLYKDISTGWNDRFAHVYRVYQYCKLFLRKYKANKKILLIAALLHDIGHRKEGDHAINGAEMAKKLLRKKGNFTSEEIKKISECIKTHNLKGKRKPPFLEAKILSDCDRLDVINIENWLYVIANEISKGKDLDNVIKECKKWEKEWFSLGVKFYTKLGRRKKEEVSEKKEEIIKLIKKFNLKNIRRRVIVFFFNKKLNEILLVKRKEDNLWETVIASIEKKENAIRTAIREINELGLNIRMFSLLPTIILIKHDPETKSLDVLFNFSTLVTRKRFNIQKKNKEIHKAEWFLLNDLPYKRRNLEIKKNLEVFKDVNFER